MKRILLTTSLVFGMVFAWSAFAATADHLVISQVQITGGTGKTTNDFVEIYNPTDSDIDLSGMRIVKRTKTGTSDTLLKSWTAQTIISAHGYYLWANSDFTDIVVPPDAVTSGTIANDNGVALRNGPNDTGVIIDSVAWGEAANDFVEGQVFATNPDTGQSLERKPGSGNGNGEDTNVNSDDFFLQTTAHPRNTQSAIEPAITNPPISPPPPPVTPPATPPQASPPGGGGSGTVFLLEINEIMPNPKGKDSGAEWVELYNKGSAEVDLSGWYLDDNSGTGGMPSSRAYLVPAQKVLPGAYLVLYIPSGKISLNNSGDEVRLFDKDKNLKTRQEYDDKGREGQSFAKNNLGTWEWADEPTPGSANIFAMPQVFYNNLRISEILPNPVGDDAEGEFIEIENYGNDSTDLAGWIVSDPRKRYTVSEDDFFDTEIPARGFFVLYREVTGISLNNDGDEIKLFDPDGKLVDTVNFAKESEGKSYSRKTDTSFDWTSKLTPGKMNEFVIDDKSTSEKTEKKQTPSEDTNSVQTVDLKQARTLPLGSDILTSGVVSVEEGVLGERIFYLSGSGIRVSLEKPLAVDLKPGDRIELRGLVDSYHSETQVKVADNSSIKVLDEQNDISVMSVKSGELSENVEGYLVTISGTISRNEGDTFFVDDGSGEARVYLKDSTKISKPEMRKGQSVEVTGIVSQYDENYRLLPRYDSDLKILGQAGAVAGASTKKSGLPRTGAYTWPILGLLGAIIGQILAFSLGRRSRALPE